MSRDQDQVSIDQHLDKIQPELRRFVGSLIPNPSDVDDVVQEVNLTVWNKRGQFEPGSNFRAWAFSIARFKALALRRDSIRNRLELFGDDLQEQLKDEMTSVLRQADPRSEALQECLKKLDPDQIQLLEARYTDETSLIDLAKKRGVSAASAHKAISRLRAQLRECVDGWFQRNL